MVGFLQIDEANPGETVSLLRSDRSLQNLKVATAAAGGVTSFNGRVGAVLPQPGDYVMATPVRANKSMTASTTTADGQLACATAVATTPTSPSAAGGGVAVRVNGVSYFVGDGTKVGVDCYFSADGGVTPRALQAVAAGDLLYWNGSVAQFQLAAATDRIDFDYDVLA